MVNPRRGSEWSFSRKSFFAFHGSRSLDNVTKLFRGLDFVKDKEENLEPDLIAYTFFARSSIFIFSLAFFLKSQNV